MTVENVILQYQKRGVKLSTKDGKLRFTAPKNEFTEQDRVALKEYKDEIIKYLSEHSDSEIIENKETRYEPFSLTDIQSSYLIGQNEFYKYGGTSCKVYTEIKFNDLNQDKVQEAWNAVVIHNDMLHAVIEETGVQRILKDYVVPEIKWEDFSEKMFADAEKIMEEKRQRLIHKSYKAGSWPLFDVEITKFKDEYIMHFSLDMLIADFVSINLIFGEFEDFYFKGKSECLTPLSFKDIVVYRENIKNMPEGRIKYQEDREYWKKKIETMPDVPQLPVCENSSNDSRFSQKNFTLKKSDYLQICNIARNEKVTPSTIILTAYAETLRRISKNKAFCIDITMSDRPAIHPDIKKVVGDFTTANILKIDDVEYASYIDEIKSIQSGLWEDLSHNSYSSTEVLRELGKKLKTEITVPAVYTSTLGTMTSTGSRKGEIIYTISQTPQVLIDCQVLEVDGDLRINWDVRKEAFWPGVIDEAFAYFCELLKKFINKDIFLQKPSFELPNSVKKIRNESNDTRKKIDAHFIYDGFLTSLKEKPQNLALYSDGQEYTYQKLSDYVCTIQDALIKRGYKKNNRVAVAVSKNVWQIASVLAVVLLGGTYLPIDVHQPPERIEKIIKSADVKYCILEKDEYLLTEGITDKVKVSDFEKEFRENREIKVIPTSLDAPAYVIFTSGSTGLPKGVVISHRAASNTIIDINQRYNVSEEDRLLNVANLAFDLSVYDIFGAFFVGAAVVQVSEDKAKDPTHWMELIQKQHITIFNSVPGQMKMLTLFLEGKTEKIIENMRLIMMSGDWIPVELPAEIHKYFVNADLVSLGGATEAAIWSIYYPIDVNKFYERSIPYGKPLSNQRLYILNERLEEVPNWISGDIYIAGDGLALEYLGDEELTKSKFIYSERLGERLYKTGDIGRYMPDGNIEFQGRADFQVKIRGHRIELGEIETALNDIMAFKALKVTVVEHNSVKNICAFSVLSGDQPDDKEIEEKLRKKIPAYMLPSLYIYLDAIPLTQNGKVDLKTLNAIAIENIEKNRKMIDQDEISEVEKNISAVWCDIFDEEQISIDEDFFDCGGDSILIVKMMTELEQRYGYKIEIVDIYAGPTIRQIAQNIII